MKLPDVNILVAVYRDDDPRHPQLAVAVEHSATLVTLDRDFARFPQLRWELPGVTS